MKDFLRKAEEFIEGVPDFSIGGSSYVPPLPNEVGCKRKNP